MSEIHISLGIDLASIWGSVRGLPCFSGISGLVCTTGNHSQGIYPFVSVAWDFVELSCTITASEFPARTTSMPHSIEFIHSRPTLGLDNRDRKRIRRHVLEARSKRQFVPQKSWLNPDLLRLPDVGPISGLTSPPQTIPPSLASSQLNVVQSQYEVTHRMLRDLHNCAC